MFTGPVSELGLLRGQALYGPTAQRPLAADVHVQEGKGSECARASAYEANLLAFQDFIKLTKFLA